VSQRVLVIGWDGGTWRVFRRLVETGRMPRLKQLCDRGASGVMTSTIPPVTPPAWTTLMTGLKPERHGIFGFMEGMLFGDSRKAAIETSRPVSAVSFRGESLIELLGAAGRKVMCVNVPMSYPPRAVNGVMLDDALGRLVDAFSDATVFLVSDHGFGPRAQSTVFPDVWLEEKGFLARKGGLGGREGSGRRSRRALRELARRAIETLLPRRLGGRLLRRAADRQTRMLASIDRERSKAYFCGFDAMSFGGVRLVEETTAGLSDAERGTLLDGIIASLMEMRDPATGEPILTGARRGEEVFPDMAAGDRKGFIPEIILEFREGYTGRIDPLATGLIGPPPGGHIGVHRLEGMFVLAGDAVIPAGEVRALHLADVAPTVLWLLDCAVPATMQGKVPLRLFDEACVAAHPVRTAGAGDRARGDDGTKPADAYTAEQEEQIRENLRRLGYLD